MKKIILTTVVALLTTLSITNAQEKYALLIGGDYGPDLTQIPEADRWNGGDYIGVYGYDEFWNDTYLMWEMLVFKKDYEDENVHVLFANSNDFTFDDQDIRYKAALHGLQKVTDDWGTYSSISSKFSELASTITKNDFLFVWVMSHGGTDAQGSYFYSYDAQKIYDTQLATWLNGIDAYKKTVFISCPSSGGFAEELEGERTVVITSSGEGENASRADDQSPNGAFIENEDINGTTYNHGEASYHLYSSLTGKTPDFQTSYAGEELTEADVNDDTYISIGEARDWEVAKESITGEDPGFSDYSQIAKYTDLDLPTILHGNITQNMLVRGRMGITKYKPHVISGTQFTFDGVIDIIGILDENTLYFDIGTTTIVNDNCKLNIHGDLPYVKGFLDFGEHVTVNSINGLALAQKNDAFINYMGFQKGVLALYDNVLSIENSSFGPYTKIKYYPKDLTVKGTIFIKSIIDLKDPTKDFSKVKIDACTFEKENPYSDLASIGLQNYESYMITNCKLNDVEQDAIRLSYCGITPYFNVPKLIENDSICWNQFGTAITLSNTNSDIKNNKIIRNKKGIVSYNKSQVRVVGNKQAINYHETQEIWSNNSHQIYAASEYSFPYYVKWNHINAAGENLEIFIGSGFCTNTYDITYNYWGSGFDPNHPEYYFYPLSCFKWDPWWNLGESVEITYEDDEQSYILASEKIEQQDYDGAESEFINLIGNYPGSRFSEEALKDLFALEQETGNDYQGLQAYYLTDSTIQNNGNLKKLAELLAINCDIMLEDYQTALLDYYGLINDSISYNDSLVALINIEYVNFLIDNNPNNKSSDDFLIKDIFNPNNEYNEKIKKYEDLFFSPVKSSLAKSLELLKPGQLLQNFPNPAKNATNLYYKLSEPATVRIKLFDFAGQLINTFNEGLRPIGTYHVVIDASYLHSGLYFNNIEVNGQITDTKKMLVQN